MTWTCPCGVVVEGGPDVVAEHRRSHPVVVLVGPISWWWGDNWNTPEHWAYVAWRERVRTGLVGAGCLVYAPHEAFKGTWNPVAQVVNELALVIADVVVNLCPPEIPSVGTDRELAYAVERCRARLVEAPPWFWRDSVGWLAGEGRIPDWFWDEALDEVVAQVMGD